MSSENASNVIIQFSFPCIFMALNRLMLIVIFFLSDICVCVCIHMHVCVCESQWRRSGVLPYHSPSYSFETRSLTEPGAHWYGQAVWPPSPRNPPVSTTKCWDCKRALLPESSHCCWRWSCVLLEWQAHQMSCSLLSLLECKHFFFSVGEFQI